MDAATTLLRETSATLGPSLAAVLERAATVLPKESAVVVRRAAKDIAFSKSDSCGRIAETVTALAVLGLHAEAEAAARILAQVPKTTNKTVFETLRWAVLAVSYLEPDRARATEIEALGTADYEVNPNVRKGILVKPVRTDDAAAGYPPYFHVSTSLGAIMTFAAMAAYGGSFTWNRKKIAAAVAERVAIIRAQPGWSL